MGPILQLPPVRAGLALRGALCACVLAAATRGAGAEPPVAGEERLRLGFSDAMFSGLNENDARASIKALAATIANERGIPAEAEPRLYRGAVEVAEAAKAAAIDAIGMTTPEYWAIGNAVGFDRFLCSVYQGDPHEEYLLLVHRQRAEGGLAALHGGRLVVFKNPRMSLAEVWLDVELARAGRPTLARHFARVTENVKVSRVVLDVFFQQVEACLVTRRSFATIVELNPQVGRSLVPVASSVPLVPALFAFRTEFSTPIKERSLREFSVLDSTTAGKQVLVIFQAGQVREKPAAILDGALALLEEYRRIRPEQCAAFVAAVRGSRQPRPGGDR